MTFKTCFTIFAIFILIFVIYPTNQLQLVNGQIESWKKYEDPGKRFTFFHPPNWVVNTSHVDATGFTEVTLTNPNSTRMKISVVYTPKDSFVYSNIGKPVLAARALTDLEEQIGGDYTFFNSTGKFRHKYAVQGYNSASDLIDYEKIKGRPGKMLIVLAKVTDQDSLVFTYSESKRLFYKSLSNASQIINSISVNLN
jgi:hypothetical protein